MTATTLAPPRPRAAAPDPGGRRPVYLQAGQVVASGEPAAISTIVGSCVAVCLFDPVAGVGGMNHYLLPLPVQRERSARFGNVAIPELVAAVMGRGARRDRLAAKVFGGACVIDVFRGSGRHLGQDNVELALRTLEAEGIPVLERDVGGSRGRKVIFHSDDGAAWVRSL
ncbi:chemotaxis protein CheD [Anaeromyxobacter paludicola]|uniref:Probable chemoreceptor glutamine deamidase CheD n=1 Tax=Anaeromyxobacter paludicola TaxID=2918171 RepID=A0ABM7XBB7_9BACT|nr:chemotaxis protein CheD [Anaeromyxobacter paludicola]BDG09111.1 putative chemoreceptor glutamine deamidase CheD [Anaeromyxobacter paludicola]